MSNTTVYHIDERFLSPQILASVIYEDIEQSWYWTDSWSPRFYIDLARCGFITICTDHPDSGLILLPQMHIQSALLDWPERRMSRSFASFVRSSLQPLDARLRITRNLDAALEALDRAWNTQSWLYPRYRTLLLEAARLGDAEGFYPVAVELRAKHPLSGVHELAAGELGYVIGKTYTSLSGFMQPDRKTWNNMGKIQLHALAHILERVGFSFWNLGQSQMQYKVDLGARIVERSEFLPRWIDATTEQLPPSFLSLLDTDIMVDKVMFPL